MTQASAPTAYRRYGPLKIILLGDSGVGKTSLIRRYICGEYRERSSPTVSVDFFAKTLELVGEAGEPLPPVSLQIWDPAGQERFHSLGTIFYRGIEAAVLVYDPCEEKSFADLEVWLSNFRATAGERVPIIVAESKNDAVYENPGLRKVSLFQALEWCAARGLEHREVSAKHALTVEDLFQQAAQAALRYRKSLPAEVPDQAPVEIYLPETKKRSMCGC